MKQLESLIDRIIHRVNVNLREPAYDVGPYMRGVVPLPQFLKFYAFYGLTRHHPLHFRFSRSSLAGSYFLGKCLVDNSVLYKSDIRGDELKKKGDIFPFQGADIPLHDDERIVIKDSYLIKTLVHNYSHDPECLEDFLIQNTASAHYANIHGSPVEGCFLGSFSTVDLTACHDCVIGTFAYVQAGELSHHLIEPGKVWIRQGRAFEFSYQFPEEALRGYIRFEPKEGSRGPRGIFMDFVEGRKLDFQKVFEVMHRKSPLEVPRGATLNRYAVVKGDTQIAQNVLVAQRAYLEEAWLGKGSNAQENCYIISSRLDGNNVTAHGGKILNSHLQEKVFVGFNAFLRGKPGSPLSVGAGSIVMPHTIVDLEEPLQIPPDHLVWGLIRTREDLQRNSLSFSALSAVDGDFELGAMQFRGSGGEFLQALRDRIQHILEANGAFFDGSRNRGHAQMDQNISFNTIQPYREGPLKGLYPSIEILP